MEVLYYVYSVTLAKFTEFGKGYKGTGFELGGIFQGSKVDANSYKDIIDGFKGLNLSEYFKDGKYNWAEITKEIGECDTTARAYFETLKDGNGVIKNQNASLDGMQEYLKKTGVASKAAAVATKAFNIALNAAIMFAVVKGIELAGKALYNYTHQVEIAKKAAEESAEAYAEAKAEIESLNDELQTTRERIRELGSKSSLTFVEQEVRKPSKSTVCVNRLDTPFSRIKHQRNYVNLSRVHPSPAPSNMDLNCTVRLNFNFGRHTLTTYHVAY